MSKCPLKAAAWLANPSESILLNEDVFDCEMGECAWFDDAEGGAHECAVWVIVHTLRRVSGER